MLDHHAHSQMHILGRLILKDSHRPPFPFVLQGFIDRKFSVRIFQITLVSR